MNVIQRLTRKWNAARHEYLAQAALARSEEAQATAQALAFHALEPDNPHAHYLLAQAYLLTARHAEALPHLEATVRLWPSDAPVWYALGVCHDYLDHPHAAIAAYRRTLALAPHWTIAWKHLGRCAWRADNVELAVQALIIYCEDFPDDQEAHDLLGYLAYTQGRLRTAYSHYVRASRLDPGNPSLDRNARILYRRSATS